jgi:hypothetical protein
MAFDPSNFWHQLWVTGAAPQCLSCGLPHAGDDMLVTAIPKFDPATGEVEYDEDSPAVAIVCGACGFIRLHRVDLPEEPSVGNGGNGVQGR